MDRKFAILIDSCGDLPKDLRERFDVDYVAMTFNVANQEYVASLDYDQGFTVEAFYEMMRRGGRAKTSAVPIVHFQQKFDEILGKGMDILYISCSSGLSASHDVGQKVAEQKMEEYPGSKIICFDPLNSCYGQAAMAIKASEMRQEGKTMDEIVAWLTENRLNFNQFATVDDLRYLKNAGRVKAGAAFFGNLFHVHPILISNAKGENEAIKKVNGKKAALLYLAKAAVESAEGIENQMVFIGHCDDQASAEFVKNEILKLATPREIYIGPIGPTVGASTGPGTIGVYTFGKPNCLN